LATVKDKNERDFRLVNATSQERASLDFNKIKVGKKTLANDVTLSLDYMSKKQNRYIQVDRLEDAIRNKDYQQLRAISNYFFDKSGIYSRLCRYMAFLYRYDWFITPLVYDNKIKDDKVIEGWYKSSTYLENCNLKKEFGEIALKVVKNGCFYGYKLTQKSAAYLQELPVDYCRSRFEINGKPAVEFNIKYFNDAFADMQYRLKVLKMFPKEFQKAYLEYQNGTLPILFQGDERGWFLLDANSAVKFNLSNSDAPLFISVIPAIIDLEDAKELDKKKMEQQILKIIIQKMPIDKNGDLIFDVEEAQQLHNNAVAMLGDAIGVDVLTTFADVEVADLSDKGNQSSTDWLERMERSVFNAAGVSQNQFNTDGNIALEKSIANDEATMFSLILQFEEYANSLLAPYNKNPKRLAYKVQILPTTVYNYKDLSKQYKEQTMLGFSKLLPQVALGQSQSTVMATAYFENQLMRLDELFVPPQMSSTTSGKESSSEKSGTQISDGNTGGRPELPDDEKSTKTIQNIEAGG
jgi:hypothetical protein